MPAEAEEDDRGTHGAVAVGWYTVRQYDTAEFLQAGFDVAILRASLEEEVEVCHYRHM